MDFVLLKRKDLSILCAVELDDSSHDSDNRRNRDSEIERIFGDTNIPLVRLRHPEKMSKQEIVDVSAEVINKKHGS